MTQPIRFDNGATYETYMGVWSRLVGQQFLDWLAPAPALRWLDVGCGNGAFTQLIMSRTAPERVHGIDPSSGQIEYARSVPALGHVEFDIGDAMVLPYERDIFDVAVMPLVIFFVPEPARGVGEMARVVRPGGTVAAYAWDMEGGGFPYASLLQVMRELEMTVPSTPHPEASRLDAMHALWEGAGLKQVETTRITVSRTFDGFEAYWAIARGAPSVGQMLAELPDRQAAQLRARMRAMLPIGADGRITYSATANAVRGGVCSY